MTTVTAEFRQGVNGYAGTADTMLQQEAPDATAGTASVIGVDAGDGRAVQSLLSFADLFGIGASQVPVDATITSATLTLQITNGSATGGVLHRMLVDWADGASWASMDGGVQVDGVEAAVLPDTETGGVSSGSSVLDVTASLQAWAAAGATAEALNAANRGWVFTGTGTDGWDFYASEGTVAPLLSVTYETNTGEPPPPPPPPSETPVTVTFEQGVSGYLGTIDTMLEEANPTTAAGEATRIGVDSGGGRAVQSLMAFSGLFGNGPGQIPAGATITAATLTLRTTNGSSDGSVLYRMLLDWDDAATWASTGNGVQTDGVEAVVAADLVTGPVSSGGTRAFDVTASLQAWASAGATAEALNAANRGWLFEGVGTDGWDFHSSEGSTRPVLTVTYTNGDEPPPPPLPTVSIATGTPDPQTEAPGAAIVFPVMLDGVYDQDIVVEYSTFASGTATAGEDFVAEVGSVHIPAGATAPIDPIAIALLDDDVVEETESFEVQITAAYVDDGSGTAVPVSGTGRATGTIADDDEPAPPPPPPPPLPTVSIATGTPDPQTEAPGAEIVFPVTLDAPYDQEIVVEYATVASGNAVPGEDFVAEAGSVIIPAGAMAPTDPIAIALLDDDVVEDTETFEVRITAAYVNDGSGTVVPVGGTGQATGTIADDDEPVEPPPPPPETGTVQFQQGVNGYTGTVDTMLQEETPATAFATASVIGVDSGDGRDVQTLLGFKNLFGAGPGQIPVGAEIVTARLTLQTTNSSGDGGALYRMLADWTDTATWASVGAGIQTDGAEAAAFAEVTTGAVGSGAQVLDVTESLRAWVGAGTTAADQNAANKGWLLIGQGTDGWDFYSSEGRVAPVLTVDYSTEPLPPSPGVTVTETGGSTTVTEGGADDTITVALKTAPASDVVVSITGNADVDRAPASLIFTPDNWDTPRAVNLTAIDDDSIEGTETTYVTMSTTSADAEYDGLAVAPVAVTVTDNDAAPPPAGGVILVPEDYATLQDAVDAARDGDTIVVGPGTYAGGIVISGKSITLTSQYELAGDPSLVNQTTINGGAPAIMVDVDAPDTVIKGFRFTASDYSIEFNAHGGRALDNFFDDTDGDAISFEGVGGVVRGNYFYSTRDDGVDSDGALSDLLVENNVFDIVSNDGIEIRNYDYTGPDVTITIRNNTFLSNREDAIQIIDYPGTADRIFVIERNLIEGSKFAGIGLMPDGETRELFSAASMPERIYVLNNTFQDNDYAISGGDNLIALNNIITGSEVMGLKNVDGDSIVAHTLFFGNGQDYTGSNVDTATTWNADPLYTADYELQAGSPAIDRGATDYVHNGETVLNIDPSEYNGGSVDLGWSEYWA